MGKSVARNGRAVGRASQFLHHRAEVSVWRVAAVGLEPTDENPKKISRNIKSPTTDDAQSDALPENPPSPALSLLAKLAAGLTNEERAALARMLTGGEGGKKTDPA